jgi:hypothetical protein
MYNATASLSPDGKRIEVRFPYNPTLAEDFKEIVPGASWSRSRRAWLVSLDLTTGRRLREAFGAGLRLTPELRRWGKAERRRLALLRQLSQAPSARLARVDRELPALAEKLSRRPYQAADIARMARSNALNANEPGTGKTIEVI